MARSRNIKPGFFRNADLAELPLEARLLFIGLWTIADREGRLEDRPKQIKIEVFPADNFDCDILLQALADTGMVIRYQVAGKRYLQVTNFTKHQNPHKDEKQSTIPAPTMPDSNTVQAPCNISASVGGDTVAIGLIPDSLLLIPDSRFLNPESVSQSALTDQPESHEGQPDSTRKGFVCGLLRKAGMADAAPHYLTDADWQSILSKRTNEEIVELAKAKMASRPGQRTGLKYIAPALLEDPQNLPTKRPEQREAPWWSSNELMLTKGKTLDLDPRPGEEWHQFRGRIEAKLSRQEATA